MGALKQQVQEAIESGEGCVDCGSFDLWNSGERCPSCTQAYAEWVAEMVREMQAV